MHWYNGLSDVRTGACGTTSFVYHGIISPFTKTQPSRPILIVRGAPFPIALRKHIVDVDRQLLIDFVNAVEKVAGGDRQAARRSGIRTPDYWVYYVSEAMIRSHLYVDDLSPHIGVRLEPRNIEGVKAILRELSRDFFCGAAEEAELRREIESSTRISELQRAAFLSMIEVRERNEREICHLIRG